MKVMFLIVIASLIAVTLAMNYYTEYLWFESLGYEEVFLVYFSYGAAFATLSFSIPFVVLTVNNILIRKATEEFLGEQFKIPFTVDLAISGLIAAISSQYWHVLFFFTNSVDFGILDPIFNFDVSFFTFKLPFLKFLIALTATSLILALSIALLSYFYVFRWVRSIEEFFEIFPTKGMLHISILAFLTLFVTSISMIFAAFDLICSEHRVVSGANYVDVNVRVPIYFTSAVLISIFSAILAYLLYKNKFKTLAYSSFVFLTFLLFSIVILPIFVQKFIVEPNELAYEAKYIEYSINYTLFAYGLNKVKKKVLNYSELTMKDVFDSKATIENVRIWDHRPLIEIYRQLQQVRPYYVINDVDVDRYFVNGSYVQLLLAAREISTERLPDRARTWVNEYLIYTHGYGLIASSVSEVDREGLPKFLIYDIPPKGVFDLKVPQIYYGELTRHYVIVKTSQPEFDYPYEDKNVYTTFNGTGVKLSGINRLLFAIRFSDINILLSEYINSDSLILFRRNIIERARALVPFFSFDSDPYIALIDGKIYWILDAYTTLSNFPYSAKFEKINYIRNPVKVFIDAYNGDVEFYVVEEDAVVKSLRKALKIFKDDMPEKFREHIRYPLDMFKVQANVYAVYHIKDVTAFYNKEDVWDVAMEKFGNAKIDVEPYYATIYIENEPEFVLMLPMTPINRDNLIALLIARCDKKYGELLVYEVPKGSLIYGPFQVEARIDQDPELSKLFTLWGQRGNEVVRGNLLVIPVKNSLLYVEPIYLQAAASKIPELRGVVVVCNEKLAMGKDIYDAINLVFGKEETKKDVDAEEKLSIVKDLFEKMLEALKNGKWAEFGSYIEKILEILKG
ncbi:MAG: UPF0182 family protein [Archaeoglobaceae archaeon]|nr:UPF0182 family protein [Archaeoglobaceae archaeon]MCX8151522.1 UPF0182 family protein [Archaeoglobaceae archaeon]MDW8013242.1 UPF0182 family protein [Archaeoglobaceae archaeon]